MSGSSESDREGFGQGGLNDPSGADPLVHGTGLDGPEIPRRKDSTGLTDGDVRRPRTYQDDSAANAEPVADDFHVSLTDYDETVGMPSDEQLQEVAPRPDPTDLL